MTEVTITREMQKFQTDSQEIFEAAKKVIIKNPDSYEYQANSLRNIKTQWSEIDEKRKELVRPFQAAVKKLNDFFSVPLNQLKTAENLIKQALIRYTDEKEKERLQEEKRLREQAEKEAAKLEKKADKLEEKGQTEKAFETRLDAKSIPVPVVAKKVEKVKGISFKEVWKFRIIDIDKVPRKYLIVDEKSLGEIARSTKGKVTIPGIEFYSDKTVAGSRI